MDLGFDGDDLGAELVVGCQGLVDRGAVNALKNRYTVMFQKCFSLVLVNVHDASQTVGLEDRLSILWSVGLKRSGVVFLT